MLSTELAAPAASNESHGARAGTVRVVANALLVLLAFEVVSLLAGAVELIATGAALPETPVAGVPVLVVVAGFLAVRWLVVLPALLAVLAGIELVARRVPHARVLTAIVAFAPMAWWQLTQSPDGISSQSVVLAATAVLFTLVARLPARDADRATDVRARGSAA